MCSRAREKKKERERKRRQPTRSNEQSRNSTFPTVCFLESSKPKNTYIRASLALRINPHPFFLSFTHPLLSVFSPTCFLFVHLLSLKQKLWQERLRLCASERGFQYRTRSNFLSSPSLSSGFSSSSSAEAMATLSLWDASLSRKRLVACKKKNHNYNKCHSYLKKKNILDLSGDAFHYTFHDKILFILYQHFVLELSSTI